MIDDSDDDTRVREVTATGVAGSLALRAARIGVQSGAGAGTTVRVDRPTFVIGSGEGVDLKLRDPTVSREHLRLALTPDGIVARDDGSKNGTWLGGSRITEVLLTTDTTLLLGTTRIGIFVDARPVAIPVSNDPRFGAAVGVSPAMRHVFALLERLAPTDVTVLLEGESGVGKEMLARALHERSRRAEGPFVAVDCGAIPAGLVESELFGHERGAFTGAVAERDGLFAQAQHGTLFLDEVGELPLEMQPKLLRVLERREIRRVGGRSEPQGVDVRIVAATNRRLGEAVKTGSFRADLFYRLAVARVTVPPLRDRPEDIEPLARAFLRAASGDARAELPADIGAIFRAYGWPGNARELRNAVERYARLGLRDASVLLDDRDAPTGVELSHMPYHEARRVMLERFERAYLPAVLSRAGGVISRAAEMASVGRASFYRMLDRSGVPRRPGESGEIPSVDTDEIQAADQASSRGGSVDLAR
jgi:transcriptional regulator with AAA-type ATPase domain